MAGYTRQSVADIVNGANITAPPLNAEFNQLASAFGVNGHTHDGSAGNSAKIDLTTSITGYLPQAHGGTGGRNNTQATTNPTTSNDFNGGYAPGSFWINTTTGRVFLCITNTINAAVWVEAVGISPNNRITPLNNNTVDIGSSTYQFKDLYIDGTGYIDAVSGDTLTLTGNGSVGGQLTVTGNIIGSGNLSVVGTGYFGDNVTANQNLTVNGNFTANATAVFGNNTTDTIAFVGRVNSSILPSADGTYNLGSATNEWQNIWIDGEAQIDSLVADTADINAGTIDNTVIGATTPVAGTFTTANATTLNVSGNATVNGNTTIGNVATDVLTLNAQINTNVVPNTDDTYDLGSATNEWRNLFIDGTAQIDSLVADTADINGGSIDGTTIGSTTPTTGAFTTVSTTGQATLATVDINGGAIDGTAIGGTSASSGAFTTLSATSGITGDLTGNVTGNVTGNISGNITGDVTGDLTGDVTSTGTSTFNNVTVNGTLNMDAGTTATIENLTDPTNAQDAATKNYVDTNDALKLNLAGGSMTGNITMTGGTTVTGLPTPTNASDAANKGYVDAEVAALVDASPAALDTLNELAAAINDDPNFATTITNSIATKLPLAGGTMSGAIAMGTNKITGMGDPTLAQDAATKAYVDTNDALKLNLTGGTMTGAIDMGANKITTTTAPSANSDLANKAYVDQQDALQVSRAGDTMSGTLNMGTNSITNVVDPVNAQDAATKNYTDSILGSATSAATSAAQAAASASAASTSETNAGNSAQLAEDWAIKTSGTVDGVDFSAKYYAQQAATNYVALAGSTMSGNLDMNGNEVQNAVLTGATISYNDITNVQASVRGELSASGDISYNSSTGVISYTQPTTVSTFTNDAGYATVDDSTALAIALG